MSLSEEVVPGLGLPEDELDTGFDPELLVAQMLDDPSIVQQVTRSQENGVETVVGYFRCGFLPGQQRVVVHVPFTPLLRGIPEVEAMIMGDMDGKVRVTDRQRYGLRLEVVAKTPATSECDVMVEVIATT